jgi:hypothetical protein
MTRIVSYICIAIFLVACNSSRKGCESFRSCAESTFFDKKKPSSAKLEVLRKLRRTCREDTIMGVVLESLIEIDLGEAHLSNQYLLDDESFRAFARLDSLDVYNNVFQQLATLDSSGYAWMKEALPLIFLSPSSFDRRPLLTDSNFVPIIIYTPPAKP